MSPGAWDALNLALCLLFAAGSFYSPAPERGFRPADRPADRSVASSPILKIRGHASNLLP